MGLETILTLEFVIFVLAATIRIASPLLLATIGEILCERSGILNLGVEGIMAISAFTAFGVCYYTGDPWLGVFAAMAGGAVFGFIHAYNSISLASNQIITGIAIVIFAQGLASFFQRVIFGFSVMPSMIKGFDPFHIPILSQIPLLGPILFQQSVLTYVALISAPLIGIMLFKTTFGLKIRATGDNPKAVATVGLSVYRIRYACVLAGSSLMGLAGAHLILSVSGQVFYEFMISGRGWLALCLVIFAKWNPYKAIYGSLLFGFIDAFQMRLQALGTGIIPYQYLAMLPYLLTVIVLCLSSKRGSRDQPRALAAPYEREG